MSKWEKAAKKKGWYITSQQNQGMLTHTKFANAEGNTYATDSINKTAWQELCTMAGIAVK